MTAMSEWCWKRHMQFHTSIFTMQAAEEPIDLCDSDDEDMPQQPARPNRPASQNAQSAVAAAEAKRRRAEAPNQAQRPEQRQLGIRDPTPRQLSSSNALLKSLAQGSNRVPRLSI